MLRLHEVPMACAFLHRELHNVLFEALLWLPACNMAKVYELLEEPVGLAILDRDKQFWVSGKVKYVISAQANPLQWDVRGFSCSSFVCSFVRPQ